MRRASTVKYEQQKVSSGAKANRAAVRKVSFKVKARPNSVVYIAGTFNQWDPAANRMEPDGSGCYITSMIVPAGRHEYKFLVNGVWHLDPECPRCVPNIFGSQNHVVEIV